MLPFTPIPMDDTHERGALGHLDGCLVDHDSTTGGSSHTASDRHNSQPLKASQASHESGDCGISPARLAAAVLSSLVALSSSCIARAEAGLRDGGLPPRLLRRGGAR